MGPLDRKQPKFESLPESAAMWAPWEPSDRLAAILRAIEGGKLAALSRMELRTFCLYTGLKVAMDKSITFQRPRSLSRIAKALRISRYTARDYLGRAAEKIREAMLDDESE